MTLHSTPEQWAALRQGICHMPRTDLIAIEAIEDIIALATKAKRLEEEARLYRRYWETHESWKTGKWLTHDQVRTAFDEHKQADAAVRSLRERSKP
jgi:hypothetical protein